MISTRVEVVFHTIASVEFNETYRLYGAKRWVTGLDAENIYLVYGIDFSTTQKRSTVSLEWFFQLFIQEYKLIVYWFFCSNKLHVEIGKIIGSIKSLKNTTLTPTRPIIPKQLQGSLKKQSSSWCVFRTSIFQSYEVPNYTIQSKVWWGVGWGVNM